MDFSDPNLSNKDPLQGLLISKAETNLLTDPNNSSQKTSSSSIYIFRKDTTIFKETASLEDFFSLIKFIEVDTKPDAFFLNIEKSDKTRKTTVVIYGKNFSFNSDIETYIFDVLKNLSDSEVNIKANPSNIIDDTTNPNSTEKTKIYKKYYNVSCTFYYNERVNPYTYCPKISNLVIKEFDKRKDIFNSASYRMKFIATVLKMPGLEQLDTTLVQTEKEFLFHDLVRLVIKESISKKN